VGARSELQTSDPHDLQRFVDAQASVYERARAELLRGRKVSHWMWFVFPQIHGLGRSRAAEKYAIASLEEARAYLAHAVLGARLRECTRIVNEIEGSSLEEVFGYPDDLKFRSCMTLFARAAPDEAVFREALRKYWGSEQDPLTLERL
jgi:uncharacterized protein (DUF1810 family)